MGHSLDGSVNPARGHVKNLSISKIDTDALFVVPHGNQLPHCGAVIAPSRSWALPTDKLTATCLSFPSWFRGSQRWF